MTDIASLSRTGLSAQANKVYDEYSKVDDDAKWLDAHKGDANIKDELATRAPDIQQNWKNFQGDVAALQNSENPGDDAAAFLLNGSASSEWMGEGADIHAILKPMTASIQAGDSTSVGIFKDFVSTIDQGNASLLHLQQEIKQYPTMADTVGLNQVGITPSTRLAPVVGGTVSADAISAQARTISATTQAVVNSNVTIGPLPPGYDQP